MAAGAAQLHVRLDELGRANGSARRQEALLLGVDDVVHGDREICHAARHGAGRRGPERAALARMVRGGSATTNAMRKEWGRKPPRNKQRTVTQCCHQRCTCGITSREGLAAGAGEVVRGAAVAAAAAAAAVGAAAAGASGRWPPETSTRPGTPGACAIHLRLAMQHLVMRVPRCLPRHLNCTCAELRRTVDAPAPGYLARVPVGCCFIKLVERISNACIQIYLPENRADFRG